MAFWDTWDTVFPEFDYRFEDDGTDPNAFINDGTGTSALLQDTGGVTWQQSGPSGFDDTPNFSVNLNGTTGGGGSSGGGIPFDTATAGTIAILFKTDAVGPPGTSMMLFQFRDGNNGARCEANINTSGKIRLQTAAQTSPSLDRIVYELDNANPDDTHWHLLVIRQTGSSPGIEFFFDSTTAEPYTIVADNRVTLDENSWFNDFFGGVTLTERVSVGYRRASSDLYFDGNIAAYGFDDSAISDENLALLMSGAGFSPFANKTIRRNGRRLYTDQITT